MADEEVLSRRAGRAAWPVRVHLLRDAPGPDLTATTTADERLSMMWPLALEAWGMMRRPLPTYARAETPVVIRRLQDPAPAR
jgi:hypothetical protein